jgi:hypothetical protein
MLPARGANVEEELHLLALHDHDGAAIERTHTEQQAGGY